MTGASNTARLDSEAVLGKSETLSEHLAGLSRLTLDTLQAEWRRLYGTPPPRLSRPLLMLAIAYRTQEQALGSLDAATRRTLSGEAATGGEPSRKLRAQPRPGDRLIRDWGGRAHTVMVMEIGFAYEGKTYRSLSQIARHITGARWSGPRFFGLNAPATKTASERTDG